MFSHSNMWCDKWRINTTEKYSNIFRKKYPNFKKMEEKRLDCKFKFYLSDNIYI